MPQIVLCFNFCIISRPGDIQSQVKHYSDNDASRHLGLEVVRILSSDLRTVRTPFTFTCDLMLSFVTTLLEPSSLSLVFCHPSFYKLLSKFRKVEKNSKGGLVRSDSSWQPRLDMDFYQVQFRNLPLVTITTSVSMPPCLCWNTIGQERSKGVCWAKRTRHHDGFWLKRIFLK